jgi:hypothetical protein
MTIDGPRLRGATDSDGGVNNLRAQLQRDEDSSLPVEFRRELEKLGFVQAVRQYHWNEVVMPALRRYYAANGDLDVSYQFVVPREDETWPKASWGWSLGFTVTTIRNLDTYAKQVAADKEELERMGFCFTSIAERDWKERVLPALATYRREFGECLVRQTFVVPWELPWPEKAWGMKLGMTVSDIRRRHNYQEQSRRDQETLDSLGFVWDVRAFVWTEQIAPALKVYAKKRGHCSMTVSFVVPSQAPWPKKAWGLKLGQKLGNMRRKGTFFEYFGLDAKWLDALGFDLTLGLMRLSCGWLR